MASHSFQLAPHTRLVLSRGDITQWKGDAIVNAANEQMLGGKGVDGAIHAAAGPQLLQACRAIKPVQKDVRCPTGEARITPGFNLLARHVIHTVGPRYAVGGWKGYRTLAHKAKAATTEEEADRLLGSAYRSCLRLANQHGLKTIAFTAISCGVFKFPHDRAAQVALRMAREEAGQLQEVHWVLWEQRDLDTWRSAAQALLGGQLHKESAAAAAGKAQPVADTPKPSLGVAGEGARMARVSLGKRKHTGEEQS